jgi:hypothetical protein
VLNHGDPSVGIPPANFEIEVKGLEQLCDGFIEDFIEFFKKDLEEHFQLETKAEAYTEEEFNKWRECEY